ncbi:MAG: terminase large subunit [Eubacteriales bacterium]|nr:terminase large subunit [Eubacteriales bacterium]
MEVLDKRRATEPIEFIQNLRLVGDFTGQPFILQPWQQEVIWNLYGTVDDNNRRQYRYLYLEIPKKNGKTPLAAALGLYHLVCDGPGGEIYCAAAERKQAGQTYSYMKSMIEQDEYLSSFLRVVDSQKEIHNPVTGTFVRVISAEAYSKHGMAPSVVIIDELHAHQKRDLWDYLTFGSGSARKEPLWIVITTAGDDPDKKTIGWEIHDKARKIKDGEQIDPTWYVKIYGAPEDADIYDEKVWYDANPSLGVAIEIEEVRREALAARNSESVEKLFRWLRLNQWVQLKRLGWLPLTLWDKTIGKWNPADMLGKYCYVGIDLSTNNAMTAADPLFPPQDGIKDWRYMINAWVPDENMKERVSRDHVPYDKWAKNKHLNVTPGKVIDFAIIKNRIELLEREYRVKYYCGDPWHLEVLRQLLPREIGDKFVVISQTMAGMSPGMHELERLYMAGEISHPDNPVDRWSFGNVVIATDGNENKKPMKNKSIDRIDPTVALINAMAGAIQLEPKTNVYEERGMTSLL